MNYQEIDRGLGGGVEIVFYLYLPCVVSRLVRVFRCKPPNTATVVGCQNNCYICAKRVPLNTQKKTYIMKYYTLYHIYTISHKKLNILNKKATQITLFFSHTFFCFLFFSLLVLCCVQNQQRKHRQSSLSASYSLEIGAWFVVSQLLNFPTGPLVGEHPKCFLCFVMMRHSVLSSPKKKTIDSIE
jgi:peptidoglycan/LPS O-acetylase OafA/YrhL